MRLRHLLITVIFAGFIFIIALSNKALCISDSEGQFKPSTILKGHTNSVTSVAFSPDGTIAITGSWDGTAKLWSIPDGKEIATLSGHKKSIDDVAISPDGKYAVTASFDKTAKLWSVADGSLITTLKGHKGYVFCARFSSNGEYILTGSGDKTAKLWRVSDGTLVKTFSGHKNWIYAVAFSSDGSFALTGSLDKSVKLWGIPDGNLIATLNIHKAGVSTIAISPNCKYAISGSTDNAVILWSIPDGKILLQLDFKSYVSSVAFSYDGQLMLTSCFDGTVKIWSVPDGILVSTTTCPDSVWDATFSPNGRNILCGAGDSINFSNGKYTKPKEGYFAYLLKTPDYSPAKLKHVFDKMKSPFAIQAESSRCSYNVPEVSSSSDADLLYKDESCLLDTYSNAARTATLYNQDGSINEEFREQGDVLAKCMFAWSLFSKENSYDGFNMLEEPHEVWRIKNINNGNNNSKLSAIISAVFPACPDELLTEFTTGNYISATRCRGYYHTQIDTHVNNSFYPSYSETKIEDYIALHIFSPEKCYIITSIFTVFKGSIFDYNDLDTSKPRTILVTSYEHLQLTHPDAGLSLETNHILLDQFEVYDKKGEIVASPQDISVYQVLDYILQQHLEMPVEKGFPELFDYEYWSLKKLSYNVLESNVEVWSQAGSTDSLSSGNKAGNEASSTDSLVIAVKEVYPGCPEDQISKMTTSNPIAAYRSAVQYEPYKTRFLALRVSCPDTEFLLVIHTSEYSDAIFWVIELKKAVSASE